MLPCKRSRSRGPVGGREEKVPRRLSRTVELRADGVRTVELRENPRHPLLNPCERHQRDERDTRRAGEASPRRVRRRSEGSRRGSAGRKQVREERRRHEPTREELPATALGLYDLCRQVAGRGGSARSTDERRRVLRVLRRATAEEKAFLPSEREKVQLKYKAAESKLGGPFAGALQEGGRGRLMECLAELERRLGVAEGGGGGGGPPREHDGRAGREEASGRGAGGPKRRRTEAPPEDPGPDAPDDAAPADQEVEWVEGCYPWTRVRDAEGRVYYFNEETAESSWECPTPG